MQEASRPRARELRLLGLCWIFLLRNQRRPAAPPLPPPDGLLQLRTLLRAPPQALGGRGVAVVVAAASPDGDGPSSEEDEAEREAEAEGRPGGVENECCVCYEPRARLRQCRFCGARLSVCLSCLLAWSKSGGGDRRSSVEAQCILCGGPRGSHRSVAGRRPTRNLPQQEAEEQWLTLYFVLFTFLQYLYLIWFVRNVLVQLVRLSIFDL